MSYRPHAEHRNNIRGVLLPLTTAIFEVFGSRAQDNGRPIGAFYPKNISANIWEHLGGIWYRARDEEKLSRRKINAEVVRAFARSIHTGEDVQLPSGKTITWEEIPSAEASKLPPALNANRL